MTTPHPTPPRYSSPPAAQVERLAREYPLTTCRLLIEATVAPLARMCSPVVRWDALVAAHGAVVASAKLRQACVATRHDAAAVARRAGLRGYVPPEG